MKRPRLQRVVQTASLGGFVALLWLASFRLSGELPTDFFLWLDPLGGVGTALAARAVTATLAVGGLVALSGLVLGRFFCGHVCPMGATLDLAQRLCRAKAGEAPPQELRLAKHWLLAAVLAAGLLGVSLVFAAAPMPLATRFWGLVVFPVVRLAGDALLEAGRPLFTALDWRGAAFASLPVQRYDTALFAALFFALLFWLGSRTPRFWCRYLCPSGALLSLMSRRPLWRRRVSDACNACGLCRRKCPMGAIAEDPRLTNFEECIACLACSRVCPQGASHFALAGFSTPAPAFVPGRRALLAAGLAGAGTAALALTGLDSPHLKEGVVGTVGDPRRVRPPGSVPEPDFLARCLRCGQCVASCPTNTLQPTWTAAGLWGVFSPVAVARRGACDPDCNACGRACPTGAIRPLDLNEKMWAKMGTAAVSRQKCLAWEFGKPCLVCSEVCPYGAIEMRRVPDSPVTVPFVEENRCTGCGACESRCPVQAAAAIRVEPMNALRLAEGSYEKTGKGMGLSIRRAVKPHGPVRPTGQPAGAGPFDPAPGAAPGPSPFDPAPSGPETPAASPFDPPPKAGY